MENPQIIHTPKGDNMVVLPLKEYERLVAFSRLEKDEDAEDARLAAEQLALIKAGKTKMIPLEMIKKKLGITTHPVYSIRKLRGLTAAQLAKKSGVGRVTITHIENRTRKGTLANYKALAKALDVKLDNIIEWSDRD